MRGQHSATRMVFVRNRRSEQRHEAVAEKLVDCAFESVHFGECRLKEGIQHVVHALGTEALGETGRVCDVAEQHRDRFTLAFERVTRFENLLGEVRRRVVSYLGEVSLGFGGSQPRSAVTAELLGLRVRGATDGAIHLVPPRVRAGPADASHWPRGRHYMNLYSLISASLEQPSGHNDESEFVAKAHESSLRSTGYDRAARTRP